MIPAGAFLSSLLPSAVVEAIVAVYNRKHQSPLEINFVLIACLNYGQRHVRLSNFKICVVNSHNERDYYCSLRNLFLMSYLALVPLASDNQSTPSQCSDYLVQR
jgi:hypothetical protein